LGKKKIWRCNELTGGSKREKKAGRENCKGKKGLNRPRNRPKNWQE
jgi:hypothetical protein